VFRKSGVVHSFKMVDPVLYLDFTSCIPEISSYILMTSLLILSIIIIIIIIMQLIKKVIKLTSQNTDEDSLSSQVTVCWRLEQRFINSVFLVSRTITFCKVASNIFVIITVVSFLTNINVYPRTCAEQNVPYNSEVRRSHRNCGSSVRNLLHVNLLAPGTGSWLIDFWKTCGPVG
jgi:hypothetical protein